MAFRLREGCERQDVANGRDVDGMVSQECFTAIKRAASDSIRNPMGFGMEFIELSVHVLIHREMETKDFVGFGVGCWVKSFGSDGLRTGESNRFRGIVSRRRAAAGVEFPCKKMDGGLG